MEAVNLICENSRILLERNELDSVRKYLPVKKSNIVRPPSIGTIDLENKFRWPQFVDYIGEDEKRLLMGLAIEIGVVFFFNNFTYTFANEIFMQMFGGPIGARLTMAVARLVMQTWKEEYDKILEKSNITQLLSGLYVDDGRHLHRKLEIGEHFDYDSKKFVLTEKRREQDIEMGLTREQITRKEILIAMNSINSDLNFTMEMCTDFTDGRLPTLSFSLWQGDQKLEHSYFEKSMKNQTLLVSRSSMSRHQIINIMSNELIRRLEVIDCSLDIVEKIKVVNKYVQQLVNSEYSMKQCREIVISGVLGYMRKMKRKEKYNLPIYRSNKLSLRDRVNKKLTEKYNWYRSTKVNKDGENEESDYVTEKTNNRWNHYAKKKEPIEALEKQIQKDLPPQAVMFVQYTENGELANRIRTVISQLKPWTGLNFKVVERVGEKLEDLLHKSNPWEKTDCKRADCFTCNSSAKSSEPNYSNCSKRSVVYQTWCQTCLEKPQNLDPKLSISGASDLIGNETGKIDLKVSIDGASSLVENETIDLSLNGTAETKSSESDLLSKILTLEGSEFEDECKLENTEKVDSEGGVETVKTVHENGSKVVRFLSDLVIENKNPKKRQLEVKFNGLFYHYIGETSRSAFERGHEHQKDLEFKRPKSHLLRHAVEFHPDLPPEKIKFRMKILSSHRSAFERQIREAVMIDLHSGPKLMNSKLEYTRCCLPKLSIKLGNKENKEDPQALNEKSVIEKIKLLYKGERKRPKNTETSVISQRKRAKLTDLDPKNDDGQKMGPVVSPKIADDDLIQGNTEITGNVEVTNFSVSSNVASGKAQQSTLKLAPKSSPLVKKLKAESKSPKRSKEMG